MTTISKENNNSSGQGQLGNLKTLRTGTYSYALALQENVRAAKKRVDTLSRSINIKEKEFHEAESAAKQAAEEAAKNETSVINEEKAVAEKTEAAAKEEKAIETEKTAVKKESSEEPFEAVQPEVEEKKAGKEEEVAKETKK